MTYTGRLRTIGKVTGVAATTAPYVRRLATDEELRDDVAEFIRSANNLIGHLRADKRLRRDLLEMVESAQSGADHLRGDIRPRRLMRTMLVGIGMIVIGAGLAIAFAWPRTRSQMKNVVDQATTRANATVHDARERISGQSGAQAA